MLQERAGDEGFALPGDGAGDHRCPARRVAPRGEGTPPRRGGARHGVLGGALAHVSGLRAEQVERRLGELQWRELVRPQPRTAVADESQYAFWHVLVRDVAYSQIPRAARVDKHRAAAEWIESLAPGRGDLTELLAHHYTSALEYASLARQETDDLTDRARTALRDAGEHALGVYAYAAAARFFREALELWPSDDPARPQLLFELGTVALLVGARRRRRARRRRARRWLQPATWDSPHRRTCSCAARARPRRPRRRCLPRRRGSRSPPGIAALARAGRGCQQPRRPVTRSPASPVAPWRRPRRRSSSQRRCRSTRSRRRASPSAGTPGSSPATADGIADLEQAVELAENVRAPGLVRSCANLATSLVELGELERAWAVYERGRDAAARFGDEVGLHWLAAERPYEHYWRGRWDDALAVAEFSLREPDGGLRRARAQKRARLDPARPRRSGGGARGFRGSARVRPPREGLGRACARGWH